MPEGIDYRGSWVTDDLRQCFQIMECQDRRLLDEWIANWDDVTDFEVIPVITSAEASAALERFSYRRRNSIAAVLDEVQTFAWGEEP